MNNNSYKCALIDGNFYAYKSYYASKSKNYKINSKYKYVATYFFFKSILSILKKNYHYIFVAFDSKTSSKIRRIDLPKYKLNRPKMPQELFIQLQYMKQLLDSFGIC